MKQIMAWFLLLSFIGLLLFAVSKPVKAQEKKFKLGVVVDSQAVFCHQQADAQTIAEAKGDIIDELMFTRKCFQGIGRGIYTKEVYRKGDWGVYEFSIGDKSFYEATDWKGEVAKPKGQVDT